MSYKKNNIAKSRFTRVKTIISCAASLFMLTACQAATEAKAQTDLQIQTQSDLQIPAPLWLSMRQALPDFNLADHKGHMVSQEDLYNHIWLVNFIDTECDAVCELQTRFMGGMQKLLTPELGGSIRFVTISSRSNQNEREALTNFIKARQLDTAQWQFLTADAQSLAAFIRDGFGLPVQPSGRVLTQSSDIFIIDWEGYVRGKYQIIDKAPLTVNNEVFTQLKSDLADIFLERKALPETLYIKAADDPRKTQQAEKSRGLDLFTDFSFEDRIQQSGINFQHKIVDDVGTDYKAIHYDHGNGMAIADVDGDGRLDIYFTTLSGTNELWRNKGAGEFENITARAGLDVSDRVGMGASFADIDNDGDPDLYITNVRIGNILFENDGAGNFKDITRSSGTGVKAHSSGAVFFDYNRDGLLDLFVTNVGEYTTDEYRNATLYGPKGQVTSDYKYYVGHKDAFAGHLKPQRNETSVLFQNLGNNRFKDVSQDMGLIDDSWSGDATVIDANNDNWPDLYIINMQGNDQYYENQNGKRFLRKSRDIFENTPWGAMGVKSFDYDNDGDMDLFVTDMHSDMRDYIGIEKEKLKSNVKDPESFLQSDGKSIFGNAFYRNNGDGSYSEISDVLGVENYWPWGPSSGDINADGYEDLFVASSMSYPFRYHVNSVLLNHKGQKFIDSEYTLGVEPRRKNIISKPWFEIDCQGRDKDHLVCVNSNTKTSSRTVVWGALGTRSAAIFDLDNDGDQDIVTLEFNHNPMVLINDLSDKTDINYIKIDLNGTQSNKDGLGAQVKIYAGGDVFTKANDGKSGYLGQSAAPLYFGLGAHKTIDKIEIVWPSGKAQIISSALRLNRLMVITEPE